jgi:hypothetical protein
MSELLWLYVKLGFIDALVGLGILILISIILAVFVIFDRR